MNPKIADFGMARNFRVDQTEDKTGRVVGTLLVFTILLIYCLMNPFCCFSMTLTVLFVYLQWLYASRIYDAWPILYQV